MIQKTTKKITLLVTNANKRNSRRPFATSRAITESAPTNTDMFVSTRNSNAVPAPKRKGMTLVTRSLRSSRTKRATPDQHGTANEDETRRSGRDTLRGGQKSSSDTPRSHDCENDGPSLPERARKGPVERGEEEEMDRNDIQFGEDERGCEVELRKFQKPQWAVREDCVRTELHVLVERHRQRSMPTVVSGWDWCNRTNRSENHDEHDAGNECDGQPVAPHEFRDGISVLPAPMPGLAQSSARPDRHPQSISPRVHSLRCPSTPPREQAGTPDVQVSSSGASDDDRCTGAQSLW